MKSEERQQTLNRLEASGLKGRGGGWFECHLKWRAVLAEGGVPHVVANGGEGEPGSIKDRWVMRTRPQDVLNGLVAAIEALGADRGHVYLKGSFAEEETRLSAALDSMGLAERISIHRGDDTYVGGEESALLESLEGRVAWPRPKPPRPSAVGLFGRPTLVQNVDTLSRVSEAVRLGPGFGAVETITLTLWGDVRSPGVYEVKRGRAIRDVIESEGHGATGAIGLVFPNGAHSLPLSPDQLEVALSPETLEALGRPLGTASLLVLDDDTSVASIVGSIARFFEREACGQCPPCVLGTANLRGLVGGEGTGANRLTPQAAIRETASFMSMHGYCGHSRAGAAMITGLFGRFEDAILTRLRSGGSAVTGRERDPFAPDSAERLALNAFLDGI